MICCFYKKIDKFHNYKSTNVSLVQLENKQIKMNIVTVPKIQKNQRRREDKAFQLEFGGIVDRFISLKIKPLKEKKSVVLAHGKLLISFCELGQQKQHLLRKCFQVMILRSHPTYHCVRIFFFSPLKTGFAFMLLSRIPKVHSQCQTTIKFSVM